ncbi:10581_t:CDS:1, partial [Scutellospora calospora]
MAENGEFNENLIVAIPVTITSALITPTMMTFNNSILPKKK